MKSERKDLHQSITLPSISDAPFLPAVVRKARDEAKAEPWRRKAIQDDSPDLDQEARARHQAQLEQRHLEAYRNMHRLRDSLYHRYAALLRDKVHSQRLELQQRYEASRAKSESETKQKQRKLAFSKLQHNDSYLKSIPKTSYYLKQLAERGHLKTHHDLEDFYRLLEQGSDSGASSGELIFSGSQEKDGFPKIIPGIPEKSRKAEIYMRRLREMHDLCLANMAFSKRLLDRQTDSLCWQEERGDHDLLLPVIDSKQEKTSQANWPPLCSPKHQGSVQDVRPFMSPTAEQIDLSQIIERGFKLWRNYKEDTGSVKISPP
ncbi:hypothetical protein D5F01_LYC21049 [Larimichthys crocea]|uniref:Uncharacterized protein n=1 Tax=Larimichthys crocea TaxID=215358 RepID=A0A6G0HN49_LARCR|nr:hypothetical protein D5F01_LYC21049 [Larimichthys crocea]